MIAWDQPFVLSTLALLLDQCFTTCAIVIVTLLLTLVKNAWKKLFTDTLADWDSVSTVTSLFAKKTHDLFSAAWTEFDSLGSFLTGLTSTVMTHFLTRMFTTVQRLPTNFLADKSLAATFECALFFATEACHFDVNVAFLAFPLMTLCFTLMMEAVEKLVTWALTSILSSRSH